MRPVDKGPPWPRWEGECPKTYPESTSFIFGVYGGESDDKCRQEEYGGSAKSHL